MFFISENATQYDIGKKPVCGYLMRVLRIFLTAPYAENENEDLNTICTFSAVFCSAEGCGAVFLRFPAHMRKYCVEVFGSHFSKFRAER